MRPVWASDGRRSGRIHLGGFSLPATMKPCHPHELQLIEGESVGAASLSSHDQVGAPMIGHGLSSTMHMWPSLRGHSK